jgi:hypothetical protein
LRKRWKIALGAGALLLAGILTPIVYVETACRGPMPGLRAEGPYRPLLSNASDQRPELRTWLTYPEWHIVYSAKSYGRFLNRNPPSAFPYFRHIKGFWSSYCALNRVASASPGSGDTKVMIYTIGISFSVELGLKALYENTLGRLFEWLGGWRSADDLYGARIQREYGAFMHETPWYAFPFGKAFDGLWRTDEPRSKLRHWERRFALGTEYGLKGGYAKLIGWASGATLGPDERNLRMVLQANPEAVAAVDKRLHVLRDAGGGQLVVDAPRYAQFTDLLLALAQSDVGLVEIAGNDDIFVTILASPGFRVPEGSAQLLSMPLDDRPGWRRLGFAVKVPRLLPLLRTTKGAGGEIEHVYDY